MSMTAHLLGLMMAVMVAVACYPTDCPIKQRRCLLPPRSSKDCGAVGKRFSFDQAQMKCMEYDYGGCGDNQNSFDSFDDCNSICPALVGECPEGYDEVAGNCYDHRNETVDNPTAVNRCKTGKGYLAVFEVGESRVTFNEYIRNETGLGLNYSCHKAMDVVFLIDTSESMEAEGLQEQFSFIRSFVSKFDFGPGEHQSQFAVMDTYTHDDFIKIRLNDYENANDFSNALSLEWYIGQAQFPHRALRHTRTDILLPENGARPNVETIVLLISDGGFESKKNLLEQAQLLKALEVELFFLLIDHDDSFHGHVKDEIFDKVVSSPPQEHKFVIARAADLTGMISTLVTEICWNTIEMWLGRSHGIAPTDDKGVCTIMNAAFSSGLRPKEEQHEYVCQAEKVLVPAKSE